MKKFFVAVALLISPVLVSAGEPKTTDVILTSNLAQVVEKTQDSSTQVCKETNSKEELEKRGCCSWHSGVCDCVNGRVVCCDGTYSPTCTCP